MLCCASILILNTLRIAWATKRRFLTLRDRTRIHLVHVRDSVLAGQHALVCFCVKMP